MSLAAESITWTRLKNAVASGGTIARSGGTAATDDSGAVSAQAMTGDGYVEFTVDDPVRFRFIGLTHTPLDVSADDIEYAFRIQAGHADCYQAAISDGGVRAMRYVADVFVGSGARLRIEVRGNSVHCYVDGVLQQQCVMTWPLTFPLSVEARLIGTAALIADATIFRQ
jgi:hypothetical protein